MPEESDKIPMCPECKTELKDGKCPDCGYKAKKDSADIETVNRFDAIDLPYFLTKRFERTPEGFLKGRAIVTNVGVFTYKDGKGQTHSELRLPEEVFAYDSVETLKLKPVTNNHPTEVVTSDNIKKYQVGNLGDNPGRDKEGYYVNFESERMTDGYHLSVDMIITDGATISDVLNGKQALSCGYTCDLEAAEPGANWCGVNYDFIQRRIRYNHVAIVETARAGDAARIRLDSADAVLVNNIQEDTGMSLKKITLDSVEYEAEAPVIAALSTATRRADEAEKVLKDKEDSFKKDTSVLEAERDSLKEKLDSKEKELEAAKAETMDQAKIDAAVNAKLELIRTAEKAGIEVKADAKDEDLKKEVIMKVFPNAVLDGKDAVYVQARFDAAVEDLEVSTSNDAKSRELTADGLPPKKGENKNERTADQARQDMEDRLTGKSAEGK